ncbi:MAG TPA: hypothetical protein VF039_12080 [Longimicrobiales bacterium]
MTPRLLPLLSLVCIALVPAEGRAQLDTPTSPLPVFQLAERHDWTLRVSLEDGSVVEGRVRQIDGDAIRLDDARFAAADVDAVDRRVRHRGAVLEGALAGGLALGAVAWLLFADGSDDDDVQWAASAAALGGAAIGALVGGLIGARVDPPANEWLPLWPGDQ